MSGKLSILKINSCAGTYKTDKQRVEIKYVFHALKIKLVTVNI